MEDRLERMMKRAERAKNRGREGEERERSAIQSCGEGRDNKTDG